MRSLLLINLKVALVTLQEPLRSTQCYSRCQLFAYELLCFCLCKKIDLLDAGQLHLIVLFCLNKLREDGLTQNANRTIKDIHYFFSIVVLSVS